MNSNTDTNAIEVYRMESLGAYVAHAQAYGETRVVTSMSAYELSGDDSPLTDSFALNVTRLDYDRFGDVNEDVRNKCESVYINREALVMFAREILAKFDN